MKLYIIAGEASGDLHGSNLIKAIHAQQAAAQIRAWGGDMMQAAGAEVVKHYRDLAFMGFVEVIKNLRTILGNLDFCKKDILAFQPDAIVLIDYPGFNLRIAKWAKQQGIKVIYYISPQIWAWHQSRVHAIKRDVDLMLVILPFEKDFYAKYGMDVTYVGHPLLDAIDPNNLAGKPTGKTIALLPGSRKQEIKKILPRMLAVVEDFPDYQFIVAGATSLPLSYYQPFLANHPNVAIEQGKTYEILRNATAALVKSGTSTLETALLDVPQVVCYAGNPISYHIAKRVVNIKYISLVNLIMDAPVVVELIQNEFNPTNVKQALGQILLPSVAQKLREEYAHLRNVLGDGGASRTAAKAIIDYLQQR